MCKFPSLSLRLFPTREERQGAGRGKNPGWFVPRTEEAQASIRPGFVRSVQTSRLGKIYHRPDPPLIGWPADTGPMGGEKSARARHLNRMVVSAIPRLSRCVTKLWQDLSWERSAGDPRARARPGQAAHPAGRGWPRLQGHNSGLKSAAYCRLVLHTSQDQSNELLHGKNGHKTTAGIEPSCDCFTPCLRSCLPCSGRPSHWPRARLSSSCDQ